MNENTPNRDPNPRGPDAPEHALPATTKREAGTMVGQMPSVAYSAVAPPPVRWIGTNFNFDKGRGGYGVNGIVLHTEVGNNAGATARFQQPGQASAHYGVAYDGHEVVQWVSEGDTAWHCGRYFPDASHMGNRDSIGIEHEDNGAYNSPRPDALYETSARLVAWICSRYGLPINHDTVRGECGHREVSIVGTGCPDALDIGRIIARANQIANPPPAPDPEWKKNLAAQAFSITMDKPVQGYDLETLRPKLTLPAGPLVFAFLTSVKGENYRMTQFAVSHGEALGFKQADLVVTPEWRRNLKPFSETYTLYQPVRLVNMETGRQIASVGQGNLVVEFRTTVGGVAYLMTTFGRFFANGMVESEVLAAAVPPKPTPVPTPPKPTPVPEPPPGALNWFQRLLDWLKGFFGLN